MIQTILLCQQRVRNVWTLNQACGSSIEHACCTGCPEGCKINSALLSCVNSDYLKMLTWLSLIGWRNLTALIRLKGNPGKNRKQNKTLLRSLTAHCSNPLTTDNATSVNYLSSRKKINKLCMEKESSGLYNPSCSIWCQAMTPTKPITLLFLSVS